MKRKTRFFFLTENHWPYTSEITCMNTCEMLAHPHVRAYIHITEKRTYTFETFIQIYVKHLHMYLNFLYLCMNV